MKMETKNGVKIFGGTFILFFISLSILSGCGLFEKGKKDNSNGNQTQTQKFTDIFTKPPLFDSSKQKYSAGKSRIYPKSSSVSVWEKVIGISLDGRNSDDEAWSIIQSSDGGYVVAGTTRKPVYGLDYDIYVVKLDSLGNVQWSKTIDRSSDDEARSIIQSSDGGYAVAGWTWSFGAGGSDFYVVKLDGSGNVVWTKTIGGSGDDYAYSIIQSSDGGYVVAGWTSSFGAGGSDFYVVKLDGSGNVVWTKTIGGSGDDYAYSIIQSSDGGYVVAGSTIKPVYGWDYDIYVVKLDSSGNVQWSKTIDRSSDDEARSIIQSSDGGYVVAGWTLNGADYTWHDIYVMKLDSLGNVEWSKIIIGSRTDYAYSIIQSSDGGYVVAGSTDSFYDDILGYVSKIYVVKLDSSGNVQWSKTIGAFAVSWSIIQSSDGGYVVAGSKIGLGDHDIYVVKLGPDGTSGCSDVSQNPIVLTDNIGATDMPSLSYYITPESYSIIPIIKSLSPPARDVCRPICVPEVCSDGLDNDCDGFVDCADSDCSADPACAPICMAEVCNDGLDNDCDGFVDCADPDCSANPACGPVCMPEVCNDGVDNDCDGLSDCADPDCSANPVCCVVGAGKEIVLPYGSNWLYLVAPLGTQIPGFENPGFDDSSWNEGSAPFGSYSCDGIQMCPFDPSSLTCWPSNSSIFLRKFFFVPSSAQSIKIKAKYNSMYAKLYLNGNLLGEGGVQACGEEITDGVEIPASPPYVFKGEINLIALQLENSQGTSFFDISIEAVVVGEACNDGLDNDCDGLSDCADPDCSANPACLPTDAPDLKAEKIKLSCNPPQGPNVCQNGYQVFFSFKNVGTQDAGPFRATIYLSQDGTLDNSDNPIGYCDFTGLAVGAWAQCVVPPTSLPPGWFVIGFVDSGNQVLEMNEQNNIISYQIPSQLLPDLTGQWKDQPEIKKNNKLKGQFKVCNEGPAPAGSFRVSIYKSSDQNLDLGDQVVDTHNISNLLGGNCHTIDINLANGNSYRNYYLIVFIDSLGQITELDEDNNVIPSDQIP
jgi:hypothetical protein